jgi:hypothetical protein
MLERTEGPKLTVSHSVGRESPRNVLETNVSPVIFIFILVDLPNHIPFPSALLIHN